MEDIEDIDGFLDESLDLESDLDRYKHTAPRQSDQDEIKAPIPLVEEPDSDPVLERPKTQSRIERISNSGLFGNNGIIDQQQRTLCRKIIGYYPPDLNDKATRLEVQRTYSDLEHAFKMSLLRSFVHGINETAKRMCIGMTKASIARSLLIDCLKNMSYNAQGRAVLIDASREIQKHMDLLVDKTQLFVDYIETMSFEMARISTLLQYDASVSSMISELENVDEEITRRMGDVEEEILAVTQKMEEARDYVTSRLQKDTAFSSMAQEVEDLRGKCIELENQKLERAERKVSRQRKLRIDKRQLEAKISLGEVNMNQIEEDIRRVLSELEKIQAMIDEGNQAKQQVERGERLDAELFKQQNIQRLIQSELHLHQDSLQVQIESLRRRSSELGQEAKEYRQKSLAASDGFELVDEVETTGWWFWRKTVKRQVRIEVRPNEKQRLQEVVRELLAEKREIDQTIAELEERKVGARQKFKKAIGQQAREYNEQQSNLCEAEKKRQLAPIIKELGILAGLKEETNKRRRRLIDRREGLRTNQSGLGVKQQEVEQELRALDEEKEDNSELERLQAELESKRQQLMMFVEEFGVRNGEEFADFMRLFSILHSVLQTLPKAMEMLSKSMQNARERFQAKVFRDMIGKLPPQGQEEFLRDLTAALGALCQLASQFVQRPLDTLLNGDPRMILNNVDAILVTEVFEDDPEEQ